MTAPQRLRVTAALIFLLTAGAVLVAIPSGPDLRLGSWYKELKVHLGLDLKGGSRLVYDADVSTIDANERDSALDGVRDVIERRVNQFGVSEPLVQTSRAGDAHRIIVELAGISDINEAIARIGETPLLEFQEEAAPTQLTEQQKKDRAAANEAQKKKADSVLVEALKPNADFAALAKQHSEDSSKDAGGDIDFVTREILVPAYADVIFDELKVGETAKRVVQSDFGYHIIKKTDERTTTKDGTEVKEVRSSHILFRTQALTADTTPTLAATGLTGEQLTRAAVSFDPDTNAPQVSLQFNDEGKKLFAEITKRNLNKPVAIVLDGAIISNPVVQTEITTGEAVINGDFSLVEAKQLVQRLNAGALPVPVTLVNQATVGPTLGRLSIEQSLYAAVIGLVAVVLFMVTIYRLFGIVAVVSLAVYAILNLAIFKLWPVTLTLTGIAGFILSIGMAVDANILIFERIREEVRAGRPLPVAIEEGFRRAWLSIRDSNVSSLITTGILAWMGTSLIKGFAITLAIGILVSMFTAITVSRTILRVLGTKWLARHPRLIRVEPIAETHS